jgi:hypothetical protein
VVRQQLIEKEKFKKENKSLHKQPQNKQYTNLQTVSLGTFNALPFDTALHPHVGTPPIVVESDIPRKNVQITQPSPIDNTSFPPSTITRYPAISSAVLFGSGHSLSEEISFILKDPWWKKLLFLFSLSCFILLIFLICVLFVRKLINRIKKIRTNERLYFQNWKLKLQLLLVMIFGDEIACSRNNNEQEVSSHSNQITKNQNNISSTDNSLNNNTTIPPDQSEDPLQTAS